MSGLAVNMEDVFNLSCIQCSTMADKNKQEEMSNFICSTTVFATLLHLKSFLITIESPVAQWLVHPTRSQEVVSSNPIGGSDFSEFPVGFINLSFRMCISFSHSLK